MKTYQFEAIITIQAANDEDALYTYNQIERYVPFITDTYCVDWNEVQE